MLSPSRSSSVNGVLEAAPSEMSRRDILRDAAVLSGFSVTQLALEPFGLTVEQSPDTSTNVAEVYKKETDKLSEFATWSSMVTDLNPDGTRQVRIEDNIDAPCRAGSVNKLATALAILDAKDKGLVDLRQAVRVPDYAPDPGADRELQDIETVDSLLTKMIVDSSNEAFRTLLTVLPGEEINKILWQKGLRHTYLEASKLPGRFYTGMTTPRDAHNLLLGLTSGNLLSTSSAGHLINLMLHSTFNLGIRREVNDRSRQLIATKYGQLENRTNEVGIIFGNGPDGKIPKTIYAFFSGTRGSAPNLPRVEQAFNIFNRLSALAVHAKLGATMLRACRSAGVGVANSIF